MSIESRTDQAKSFVRRIVEIIHEAERLGFEVVKDEDGDLAFQIDDYTLDYLDMGDFE